MSFEKSIHQIDEEISDCFESLCESEYAVEDFLWRRGVSRAESLNLTDQAIYNKFVEYYFDCDARYERSLEEKEHRLAMEHVLKQLKDCTYPESVDCLFDQLGSCVTRSQKMIMMEVFWAKWPKKSLSAEQREIVNNITWFFDIYPDNAYAEKEIVKSLLWRQDGANFPAELGPLTEVEEAVTVGAAIAAARKLASDFLKKVE